MKRKFSKKIGTGVMALLITVCFIPAMAGAFTPGYGRPDSGFHRKGPHRPVLGIWRDSQMVQKLGLTQEQVKQVRDADFSFLEKRLALKTQLDRLQMDKAFSEDVVDDTVVLSSAEKISGVEGKMFVQEIQARLALGKILNADQIKKLKLYDMNEARKGPRPGKKSIFQNRSIGR